MTDEQAFAWLRQLAPSAGTITVDYPDGGHEATRIRLEGATSEDVERVRTALGIRFPLGRWNVSAPSRDKEDTQ